ncbi:MAG TPA: DUF6580 family putative transport protein, partial [Bacteroidales bacterium]|nr:DUF6580 family putative transport protein [Bacteroidales bacterium]
NFSPLFFFVVAIVILSVALRLLPTWPNFTPLAAMALFAGTYVRRKDIAIGLPLLAMLLSDMIIGFHQTMLAVYGSLALVVVIGFALRQGVRPVKLIAAALGASVTFYMITNFAVWLSGMVGYPMSLQGLLQCYVAAVPFFRNAILGDLFYTTVFFGSYYLIAQRYPVFARR